MKVNIKNFFNRRGTRFFVLGLIAFVVAYCAEQIAPDIDTRGTGGIAAVKDGSDGKPATDILILPTKGTVDISAIPPAKYKLASIKGYMTNSTDKSQGYFERTLKNLGEPSEEDTVIIRASWGPKGQQRLEFDLSLPYVLETVGDKASVKFSGTHFFWNSVWSDGNWRTRLSGKESGAGLRFHEIFANENNTRAGGVFKKTNVKTHEKAPADSSIEGIGTATLQADTLTLHLGFKRDAAVNYVVQLQYKLSN